jgi:hypothetical protein
VLEEVNEKRQIGLYCRKGKNEEPEGGTVRIKTRR